MKLDDVPSWLIGIFISLLTSLIVFNGTFSSLATKVEANTDKIKSNVTQAEFEAIVNAQNDRLNRIENKVDKILERTK